eukprot:scaffold453839_cov43-Prasinocladus_malaysianus.AAC.1
MVLSDCIPRQQLGQEGSDFLPAKRLVHRPGDGLKGGLEVLEQVLVLEPALESPATEWDLHQCFG